jgi:hypothetical protein
MTASLFETTGAAFSPCRTWRYELWRKWKPGGRRLVMLMLNPSTADETANDATVERCERRARSGGFGELRVFNIFAFRATDPADMKAAPDPVGPQNDEYLSAAFGLAKMNAIFRQGPGALFCAGWGIHGSHAGRDRQVQALAAEHGVQLMCLGTTKDGQPRHPLYVGYDVPFQTWSAP